MAKIEEKNSKGKKRMIFKYSKNTMTTIRSSPKYTFKIQWITQLQSKK